MLNRFKNITGSPKTTILGMVLLVFSGCLGWFGKAGLGELFPMVSLGAWLFIATDKQK